ncbi:MAG: hypothetical protein ACOYLB_17500 [Phototrophicaceae bacterium]
MQLWFCPPTPKPLPRGALLAGEGGKKMRRGVREISLPHKQSAVGGGLGWGRTS